MNETLPLALYQPPCPSPSRPPQKKNDFGSSRRRTSVLGTSCLCPREDRHPSSGWQIYTLHRGLTIQNLYFWNLSRSYEDVRNTY